MNSADKMKAEALAVFDDPECPQDTRDVIEWFYSSMLVDAVRYRLLNALDTIEPTDEFLKEDCITWAVDPGAVFVGARYQPGSALRVARRKVASATAGPMSKAQTQHDRDSAELRRLAQEVHDLKRWKSTNAPRLAMLQEWKAGNDHAYAKAIEAGATLQSERDANAILTYELDALKLAHQKLTAERDQLAGRLVQQEQAGWIPTSGQLPPIQTRVLCMDDREHCEVDMWRGPDFNFCWPYWQPLPAAPKQGGDKP